MKKENIYLYCFTSFFSRIWSIASLEIQIFLFTLQC